MENIKILVCHHKDAPLIKEYENKDIYINVLGGKSIYKGNSKFLLGLVGDNTGDNISNKNLLINELTVVYWAWKNYDKIGNPDYIGLNHYRRIFETKSIQDYKNYDMILWKSILPSQKCGNITMGEQFKKWHGERPIKNLFEYIDENKTEINYEFVKKAFDEKIFYPKNMFIMKRDLFFKYCEMMFPLILGMKVKFDNNEKFRDQSFISERVSSAIFGLLSSQYKTKFIDIPQKYI